MHRYVSEADVCNAEYSNAEVESLNGDVLHFDYRSAFRLQYLLFHFLDIGQQAIPLIRQMTHSQQ